jgi:hypothetical protein
MTRAALVLVTLLGCKHSATGVTACDDHLAKRHACAQQLGGSLGASIEAEGARLEATWSSASKRDLKGWKDKYGKKWCTAATADAKSAFPECTW